MAAEKPIVLKLAHITAGGGIIDKQAQRFADLLTQSTKGRVKVDIYPAQQLGNMMEILEGVSMGSIDMAVESEAFVEMFEKNITVFQTPFLLGREKILKSKYLLQLRENVRKRNNVRTLPGFGWRPGMHLWTQARPVRTPDELNNIKIRLWQQKVQIDTWNALGARAIPLPWGEVYMALAQKIVNGMPHNIVQIKEEKFYEQLDYCTYLDFMPAYNAFWINDTKYNKFPKEIQDAINESSIQASKYFTELGESLEKDAKSIIEKAGVKFLQTDREIWVKKANAVHRKLENEGSWSKGILEKLANE
jgi:TRAP-type C4-dicarboxylate transport system substrate-binding protein